MFTVLFTAIGRRVELINAFKASYQARRLPARVIGVDLDPYWAPASLVTDAVYQVPACQESGYIQSLLEICRRETVNLLIPLYEPEFLILDQHRDRFEKIGTKLLLSNKNALQICMDKCLTYQFFNANRVKTPFTWWPIQDNPEIGYPLFLKPRYGMGSVGARKIERPELMPGGDNSNLIAQEFISGTEYTLDVLADFQGRVLAVVPRERIQVRAGEVIKSRTVKRRDLIEQGAAIAGKLGVIGPINIQCIDNGAELFWLEINPRFGGGAPLSIKAGVDYPYLLYQLCQGRAVEPLLGQFQDNLVMLRYEQGVYI